MTTFVNFLVEKVFLWVALGIVFFSTYLYFGLVPYLGFDQMFSGRVALTGATTDDTSLQTDDMLLAVNGIEHADLIADRRKPMPVLSTAKPGDHLKLTVMRPDSEVVNITWIVPGFTPKELAFRLTQYWWIGFVYWVAALATVLFVRPKDLNRLLLISFFLITAVWLSAGHGPVVYSSMYPVFTISVWLTIPIYLHLHWIFPKPLYALPRWPIYLLYALCLPLIVLELLALIPAHSYYVGGLISMSGTSLLVITRFLIRPEERHIVRIMVVGVAVSFLPLLIPIIARLLNFDSQWYLLIVFGMPVLPLSYFYMAYRYQLGAMELRANRLIALYLYFLASVMIVPLLLFLVNQVEGDVALRTLVAVIVAAVTIIVSAVSFPHFQRVIETHLLGMPSPPERLLHTYPEQISATSDFAGLTNLLRQEVLPSLLIRQSVLFLWDSRTLSLVDRMGVDDEQLPAESDVPLLLSYAQRYLPVHGSPVAECAPELAWIRLILPLRFDGNVIGLWLLGQRDPDDFYSHREVEMLAALTRQTAVAASNIIQTERLRLVYQANVERHELERKKLALMLHDEVLNRQAQILWDLPPDAITPEIDSIYRSLTEQVRQIILDLRPPLLEYGLHLAIEQLVDNSLERNPTVALEFDVDDCDYRYPLKVEEHVFRIVQQALENALAHAGTASIHVSGHLGTEFISLQVRDSGDGFDMEQMTFHHLLMERHFGLIGMQERATLIGATLLIHSSPGAGTTVALTWRADDHTDTPPPK